MAKTLWIFIAVTIAIVIIGGAFLLMNPKSTPSSNTNPSTLPANTLLNNPASSSASNPATQNINIQNFAFSPSSLTINKCDSVVWANQDSAAHAVISDSGSEISSTSLSIGQSYSHTFNQAGTYDYHCGVHPSMKGEIIVQ